MEHTEHSTPTTEEHGRPAVPVHDPHGPGYELQDTNVGSVFWFGVVLVVLIVVVNLALLAVYGQFVQRRERKEFPTPPEPIAVQLRELRRSEDDRLTRYDWADRRAGIVRIPIDRALDLVAERGVPQGKGPQTEEQINSRGNEPGGDRERPQGNDRTNEPSEGREKNP